MFISITASASWRFEVIDAIYVGDDEIAYPDFIEEDAFDGCSATINVPWSEGEVDYAPWSNSGTINYNYTGG
jgi:hypothetical protein